MTQDRPLLAVQEALKKCFPVVEEQQGLWQSALRDCQPLLSSLSNLAEQLQAAQNLRFEDVPALRAFPDLKERLRQPSSSRCETWSAAMWSECFRSMSNTQTQLALMLSCSLQQ
ncbi:C1orf109 isoform 1 [Pan troglodytes]|uniref:C1orf109 isoform 5 n=3 Tax=Hominidae TaxID=9604 RepID=A0A2J8Y6L4_PONAB|nr:C1orf109 protein [Homo sapiens]PNI52320.1 C1orf109 isoform 1 [Pan troglodytes]PNJ89901.1 C1orf109 isoform 5 [Pongo abelii]EAX07328.1 chromosome 1 open reading frame 109, isoform CRA_b [Homo sapiens]KAI2516312.1 hypothetical protein KI723_010813 [Homo sapiens]